MQRSDMDERDRKYIKSALGVIAFLLLAGVAYFVAPYTSNPQLIRQLAGVALLAGFAISMLARWRRGI